MSKRGYAYLRTLLIHGARSAILAAKNKIDNTQGMVDQSARAPASEYRRSGFSE
jgi:hypothetical protein